MKSSQKMLMSTYMRPFKRMIYKILIWGYTCKSAIRPTKQVPPKNSRHLKSKIGTRWQAITKNLDLIPAHITVIMGKNSTQKANIRKAYKYSWYLSRDNEELFVHHPWEEEPVPEPNGLPNGLLVSTDKITYSVSIKKIKPRKSMALVDWGAANGIVTGTDCA